MKKAYVKPCMYVETFIAEQYVAASTCGTHVGVPDHGHFENNVGETHCAFTSSNCGDAAESCHDSSNTACTDFNTSYHQVITEENGNVINKPKNNYHNCHILSTTEAANWFVKNYSDKSCKNGVAALLDLKDFEEFATAFS